MSARTVYIPEALWLWLTKQAASRQMTRSKLICEWIVKENKREQRREAPQRR